MSGRPVRERLCILLTGANGQVGHELAPRLARLGRVVRCDRAMLDMAEADEIRRVVRTVAPHLIVNAAAYTAVDLAESDAGAAWAINGRAPAVLGAEAARLGAGIVHFSTDYVFDGTKDTPYVETDPTNPLSVYGRSKLAGEEALARSGAPFLVFRTSWVFGTRGSNFLTTMLRLARDRREIRVVDDQRGNPTWSVALAEGVTSALARLLSEERVPSEALAAHAGVYHLTGAGDVTWREFAVAILAADPARAEQRCRQVVPIATSEYPAAAARPHNSRLDCSKSESLLAVRLPPWEEQLAQALAERGPEVGQQ